MAERYPNKDPTESKDGLVLFASLALEGRRYQDMIQYTKMLVGILSPTKELSEYERKLFKSAGSHLIAGQRRSWRYAFAAAFDESDGDPLRTVVADEYRQLIASEISRTCSDIIGVIDLYILPSGDPTAAAAASAESRAFYNRMKGDLHCCAAEVKLGQERATAANAALEAYMNAKEDAVGLSVQSPTRLGLDLELALFHADISEMYSDAYTVAKEAFDIAKRAFQITREPVSEEAAELFALLLINIDLLLAVFICRIRSWFTETS